MGKVESYRTVLRDLREWDDYLLNESNLPGPRANLELAFAVAIVARDASQMNVKADEEGFIVVYPQALGEPLTWFGVLFGEQGHPDMNFFRDLVVYLQTEISVDPAMIYVTGISNGGSMAIAGKAGKKRSQAGRFD